MQFYSDLMEMKMGIIITRGNLLMLVRKTLKGIAHKKYRTKYDWVGKVIHWELCKKLKFDHTCKWYLHNPTSILQNNTHKFLWDFDIQTDHLISARRPDVIIINKKKRTCKIEDIAILADHRVKLKGNRKNCEI